MAQLTFQISDELEKEIEQLFVKKAREVLAEVSKQELNSKEYFTQKEAAEWLGISFVTLKNWQHDHGLKIIQIGGKTFIAKKTLIDFLSQYEN